MSSSVARVQTSKDPPTGPVRPTPQRCDLCALTLDGRLHSFRRPGSKVHHRAVQLLSARLSIYGFLLAGCLLRNFFGPPGGPFALRSLRVRKKQGPSPACSEAQRAVALAERLRPRPKWWWRRRRAASAGGMKMTARSSSRAPAAAPPCGSTKPASSNGGARARGRTQPTAAASAWTITAMR